MTANPATPVSAESLDLMANGQPRRANFWGKIAVATLTLISAWVVIDSVIWPWASSHFALMNHNLSDYFNLQRIFQM
jgi:hypothetical protein